MYLCVYVHVCAVEKTLSVTDSPSCTACLSCRPPKYYLQIFGQNAALPRDENSARMLSLSSAAFSQQSISHCVLPCGWPVPGNLQSSSFPARCQRRRDTKLVPRTVPSLLAQTVIRLLLTAESRDRSHVSPCRMCGGQSGTVIGVSPSTWVLPCLCHSVMLHTHIRLGLSLGSFQKAMLSRKSGSMGQKKYFQFLGV